MNLINLFKSLEKKKSKQHLWLIISNVMFLKEVLMLKTFFPLNNCSFDFSANLYSPSSATVRQFWFFSANEGTHTHPQRTKKCFAGLDGMWIHELLNFGALKWFGRERESVKAAAICCKETCQEDVIAKLPILLAIFCWPGLWKMAQVPEEWCCGSELRLEFSSKLWSHPIQSIQIDN